MNLAEIFVVAYQSVKSNRLRAGLTILGVVVGIFSIILIMTIITMLQKSIESGFSSLNKNTFQIQKWEAMQMGPHQHKNRKDITIDDFYRLKDMLTQAQYIGAEQWQFGKLVKYGNKETNPNIQFAGVSLGAMKTNDFNVAFGRDFIESDVTYSRNVCLLGQEVSDKLFTGIDPVGQTVIADGYPLTVLGLLEKQPQMFGQSRDNYIVMPITTFQNQYGKYSRSVNITVMTRTKEDYDKVIEAATGYMRIIRKNQPGEDNDFFIFSNESMISQVNDITSGIKIGALAVSIIALLAAGVGIMNIMLVSVTERTKEIGIRKAVGAKRSHILMQFLFEAVLLCFFGGIIGIVLGVGLGNLVGGLINAQTAIPYDWIMIGISICVFVGLLFGTYPAYKAANLDPIEALRYE
ncbi:MAG: ABC transporter permease [Ignavibacteriales bacterium]|nr:ABC transporter permease [Ignavibacteriales bacterium]